MFSVVSCFILFFHDTFDITQFLPNYMSFSATMQVRTGRFVLPSTSGASRIPT